MVIIVIKTDAQSQTDVALDDLFPIINRSFVFAGPNLGWLRGNQDIEMGADPKLGYAIGISVDHPFSQHFYSSVRFFFERKGHRQRFDYSYYDPDQQTQIYRKQGYKSTYDYLVLAPVLYYQTGAKIKIITGFGGFAGYLLKQEFTAFELITGYINTNDYTDRHKQFEFGASLILGCKFSIGGSILTAQLENHLGLSNISAFEQAENNNLKTNSLNLILGFSLPKKPLK